MSAGSIGSWDTLISEIDSFACRGWYMDFPGAKERNLGQATLFGDLLTFTTYIPSADICSFAGQSNLYAVYYKTGTAYFESVIGTIHHDTDSDTEIGEGELEIKRTVSLGDGLAVTPNFMSANKRALKPLFRLVREQLKPLNRLIQELQNQVLFLGKMWSDFLVNPFTTIDFW